MNLSIKLLASAAMLLAASTAAFGQTVVNSQLTESSPLFGNPEPFQNTGCMVIQQPYFAYATHSIAHAGGTLDVSLQSEDYTPYLGIYNGAFNPEEPCENAVAYIEAVEDAAEFSEDLPEGTYTLVSTTYDPEYYGAYRLTFNATLLQPPAPAAPTPVPVAGIPALALTSLGLIGAAGFVSRRRKAKAEKA